jgi:hypothetical protein
MKYSNIQKWKVVPFNTPDCSINDIDDKLNTIINDNQSDEIEKNRLYNNYVKEINSSNSPKTNVTEQLDNVIDLIKSQQDSNTIKIAKPDISKTDIKGIKQQLDLIKTQQDTMVTKRNMNDLSELTKLVYDLKNTVDKREKILNQTENNSKSLTNLTSDKSIKQLTAEPNKLPIAKSTKTVLTKATAKLPSSDSNWQEYNNK